MPINAGYEFERAKVQYEKAATLESKLAALQEMYRTAPDHKGSEKLRAEISKKMALLRRDIERKGELQAKRGAGEALAVKKDGCGQIALVGLSNSGKSTVLKALTSAEVDISAHPFSTQKPVVGMHNCEGARIQLVEIPALLPGSAQGRANGPALLSLIRSADAVVLVLNGLNAVSEFEILQNELRAAGIRLNQSRPRITVTASESRGVSVAGKKFLKISPSQLEEYLKSQGHHHVHVLLEEPLDDIQKLFDALDEHLVFKRSFALLNFKSGLGKPVDGIVFPTHAFSDPAELTGLSGELFDLLERVRVYTKKPGQKADRKDPLVLKRGSTIAELALHVHKEIAKNLKHARLFGPNARFQGQRIQKDYVLKDGDVIEIQF